MMEAMRKERHASNQSGLKFLVRLPHTEVRRFEMALGNEWHLQSGVEGNIPRRKLE